jgi:hypothetical protein
MLSLDKRIELLDRLGKYMLSGDEEWVQAKHKAAMANSWFTPEHITIAINNIVFQFLQKEKLWPWVSKYNIHIQPKKLGIVMAGNIPLVGFHDFLCGFISGHRLHIKPSSKDEVLIKHLLNKLIEWEPAIAEQITVTDLLKNCDAYIATGTNNTARYFEQYFGKYPHIIRQNRTSVAILDGTETEDELKTLADDVFVYFGLGCRNVTQIHVPANYNFSALLNAFSSYQHLMNNHKYKNNYDYYLAIYLLNKVPYLTNNSVLLIENDLPFSNISVLHYSFYTDRKSLLKKLSNDKNIQSIIGKSQVPFGKSQQPLLTDYPDGVDTMFFLTHLN